MYHDKRFQKDSHFALIAFNHEQIKQSTSSGYLLAETPKFDNISKRLMDVDIEVTSPLSIRRDSFISPGFKDFFSAVTLKFDFLP